MKTPLFLCCVVIAVLIAPMASAQVDPSRAVAEHLVDDLHSAFGTHPMRAVHAKGILLQGDFKADRAARGLTQAAMFDGRSRPITVRFSDFTGFPDIPDASADANPRGLAFKIHMKTEKDYDVVAHSFDGFPVATAAEFGAFMRAIGASREATSHPNAVDAFLETHPAAKTFVTTQKPPPQSFATLSYFGVNAFKFTNAADVSVYVRYRLVPVVGEHYLSPQDAEAMGPDYLQTEIAGRVARAPLRFIWYAQIAEPGDIIDDPSRPWPASRRLVKLGVITIKRLQPDAVETDKDLIFLPGRVPDGVEVADPMLTIRNDAYAVSLEGR